MTRAIRFLFVAASFLLGGSPALTRADDGAAAPSLVFKENGETRALILESMDAHVVIRGLLAETTMTLVFRNPHDRVLEGELLFPVPEGATVSGYGLDVDGTLVEGVVVEKQKARVAFEKEMRRRVDPGLVEWTRGNTFRTRVYPVPPSGTRTIMVRYVGDLLSDEGQGIYVLPLNMQRTVKKFHLKAEVVKGTVKPEVTSGLANFSFAAWEDRFVAEAEQGPFRLDQDLRIALPQLPPRLVSVEEDGDRGAVFIVHDTPAVTAPPAPPAAPRRIGLFWDASLSRAQADRARELALLPHLVDRWGSVVVDVVVFRDRPMPAQAFVVTDGDSEALEAFLRDQADDGGTALGSLSFPREVPGNLRRNGQADAYDLHLLISDGFGNLSRDLPEGAPVPLYTVASMGNADHLWLGHLARASGGEHLNLSRRTPAEAAAAVGAHRFAFLGAEYDDGAIADVFPRGWHPVNGRFQLAGRLLADEATLVLRFGYRGGPEHRVRLDLRRGEASETGLVPRFWAQQKVNDLAPFPERNKAALLALGRRYGLVTPGTSLLVLETLEQHLEHDVEPPASRAQMRQAWRARKAVIADKAQEAEKSKLEKVVALWQARVTWWEKDFTDWRRNLEDNKRHGAEERDRRAREAEQRRADQDKSEQSSADEERARAESMAAPSSVGARPMEEAAPPSENGGGESPDAAPQATITIKPWDPRTPYMATLKAAHARGRAYASYLDQRAGYGDSPAYYLDVANWFASIGETALGHRVLTSILDLGLDDPALQRVVAYRLMEQKDWDEAVRIFESVLALRPEEPQSHRDLALALARRGENPANRERDPARAGRDLTRAMDLLHRVVIGKWDRFAEIELIALEELNRLISLRDRLPEAMRAAIRVPDLDKRLRRLLDLDLRIVMSWDADLTDIDIWVFEPSGEKADYSNPLTAIGGSVSRDFTQGYGPEEYALHHLVPGRYRIQANYYGSSQQKLTGSVTVKAVVITNYGRANEKRQELTLRLPEETSVVDVGSVELEAAK